MNPERAEYQQGHRGAILVFACSADTPRDCVSLITTELSENGLTLRGFEYMMDSDYIDRNLSEYEESLVAELKTYPVQFRNVHFFAPDS